jgi:hypothetical protein
VEKHWDLDFVEEETSICLDQDSLAEFEHIWDLSRDEGLLLNVDYC